MKDYFWVYCAYYPYEAGCLYKKTTGKNLKSKTYKQPDESVLMEDTHYAKFRLSMALRGEKQHEKT